MNLTKEESKFLAGLLTQISINPAAQDAAQTVVLVQSILEKLNAVSEKSAA